MFNIDDYVVIIGSTKSAKKEKDFRFKICQVLAVGADELIVVDYNSYSDRWLKVPKVYCQKIMLPVRPFRETRKPAIGQMVMELRSSYTEKSTRVGILLEIITNPGYRKRGIVLVGNENIEMDYENLMLLED